jgi:hypothetical protein
VPRHFVATSRDDLPVNVTVEVEVTKGALQCTSLHAVPRPGGPALTGDALRKVPVEQLMRAAVGVVAILPSGTTGAGVFRAAPATAEMRQAVAKSATGTRGRRRGTTDETAALSSRVGDLDEQLRRVGEKQPIKVIRRILADEGKFYTRQYLSGLAAKERRLRGGLT